MVRHWIAAAVANPLLVMIVTAALTVGGAYAFLHVNIEAYPDPAPAIVEVVAQYPGASAEEVERQVTIPIEVALAGMPGLDTRCQVYAISRECCIAAAETHAHALCGGVILEECGN